MRGLILAALAVYMELAFHLYMGLDMRYAPVFLTAAAAGGLFAAAVVSLLPRRAQRAAGAFVTLLMSVVCMTECIVRTIFQQYFQVVGGLDTAAGNHLGDYKSALWEALRGHVPGVFLLVLLPGALYFFVTGLPWKDAEKDRGKKGCIPVFAGAILFFCVNLACIFLFPWKGAMTPAYLYRTDLYTDDQVEQLGLGIMLFNDIRHSLFGVPETAMPEIGQAQEEEEEPEETYEPNMLDVDFEALEASASSEEEKWLSSYFGSLQPVRQNAYTGMFEGYNVIFITAEGFSGYMIDPELTPVLYRLSAEGFVFENFYSPLHFTSTSGGEFQNLTGLYPKAGFPVSLTESGERGTWLPFTLANALQEDGYTSIGYHFNQNMYGRELSHPNLGYEWRQTDKCGRPVTKETDDSGHAFWPQSDAYMVEQTFDDYMEKEPFNVYYLTISMHLPYGYDSNEMSRRNWEKVADLPYSDKTKAYIASGLELEKGLAELVDRLEEAGIADHTLLVMAPDHIPYSDLDILEELAGREFGSDSVETLDESDVDTDVYRNTWILWSASMEEPVKVDKVCSQVDILPTLLNLLGAEYDSRMLAGTDALSDREGLAVFFSQSWISDQGSYSRYTQEFLPAQGVSMTEEEKAAYVEKINETVSCRLRLGELIVDTDYYRKAVP